MSKFPEKSSMQDTKQTHSWQAPAAAGQGKRRTAAVLSWIALTLGGVLGSTVFVSAAHGQGKNQGPYMGIGREATSKEVAAWDIDVRPDFVGLPKGAGSVRKGQELWEGKCASCHGVFGEANEVFSPLIGGTTKDDVKTGNVASLKRTDYPGRTTLMKLATVSTLWDYINRAMPWNAPKSLKPDEVYALTAYLLNMAEVLPEDYVLSDKNMPEAQSRMPNRNGMTTQHALWPGKELGGVAKPDAQGSLCMKNCPGEAKVASILPDHARNNHGNLAQQNRTAGAQHGVDTSKPERKGIPSGAAATAAPATSSGAQTATAATGPGDAAQALMKKNNCLACHSLNAKLVGPGFNEIAKKHAGKAEYLADKIKKGGTGVWGPIPMPAQTLSDNEAKTIAEWLSAGMPK